MPDRKNDVSLELPVVDGSHEYGRVDPRTVAAQLKAIQDEFLKVLNGQDRSAAYALKTIDLTLTVSVSGTLGWVTTQAAGSLALHFE